MESSTVQLSAIANDPKKLQEIPGIGKGMAANIQEIEATGTLPLREELLQKYRPTMLELLRLPGMGPKTVALLWDAIQVASVEDLEEAIAAEKLARLPRFGKKQIEKLRKGIEEYKEQQRALPDRRCGRGRGEADRVSAGVSGALRRDRRRARCAADAIRSAIWTFWSPGRRARRIG